MSVLPKGCDYTIIGKHEIAPDGFAVGFVLTEKENGNE